MEIGKSYKLGHFSPRNRLLNIYQYITGQLCCWRGNRAVVEIARVPLMCSESSWRQDTGDRHLTASARLIQINVNDHAERYDGIWPQNNLAANLQKGLLCRWHLMGGWDQWEDALGPCIPVHICLPATHSPQQLQKIRTPFSKVLHLLTQRHTSSKSVGNFPNQL